MNKDWQTVTEKRQMQQSVTLALPLRNVDAVAWALDSADGSPPPRAFNCFIAFALRLAGDEEGWLT